MPKKEDCIDCVHRKSLSEKKVYCGFDNRVHIIDENHCAASDWGVGSSAEIKNLVEVINRVENHDKNMHYGAYYRKYLKSLRHKRKSKP